MNLSLTKPLAFFDLETTGINVAKDRIVEISVLKIHPDGTKETLTKRCNPEIPIPLEASEVHGIYDVDVLDEPKFVEIAPEVYDFMKDSDLAGYNSNRFDIPLLMEEFLRVGIDIDFSQSKFVDVQTIFHKMEQRTLSAAYKFYCQKELENAHSAEADIHATYEVLESQLERYPELETNTEFLQEFTSQGGKSVDFAHRIVYDKNKTPVFNFGKHKGKSVAQVFEREPGYYSWMMQGEFPRYTKQIITKIKEGTL